MNFKNLLIFIMRYKNKKSKNMNIMKRKQKQGQTIKLNKLNLAIIIFQLNIESVLVIFVIKE